MNQFITFSDLRDCLMLDPFYGVKSELAATQSIINNIHHRNNGNQQYKGFKDRFGLLPCSNDQQHQLVYLWCGTMGLPAYRNGTPLAWKWRDFLENWTQGFEIPLDELRDFLRSHSYPLPVAFFPDEVDNTERKVSLEEVEFDQAFHEAIVVIPELKHDLAELKGIRPSSMKKRQQKKDAIKKIEQQIKAIKSRNNNTTEPRQQQTRPPMVKQDADLPNPYIAYPKAIKLLDERLNTTPEELAAWIWVETEHGGLTAYLHGNELNPPPIFHYSCDNQEDFDYISPLMACWFHIDDISNFQPTDRYITGKALIERWDNQPNIRPKGFIQAKIAESRLLPIHPLASHISDDYKFPLLESGLFVFSHVETIEAEDFGIEPTAGWPPGNKETPKQRKQRLESWYQEESRLRGECGAKKRTASREGIKPQTLSGILNRKD